MKAQLAGLPAQLASAQQEVDRLKRRIPLGEKLRLTMGPNEEAYQAAVQLRDGLQRQVDGLSGEARQLEHHVDTGIAQLSAADPGYQSRAAQLGLLARAKVESDAYAQNLHGAKKEVASAIVTVGDAERDGQRLVALSEVNHKLDLLAQNTDAFKESISAIAKDRSVDTLATPRRNVKTVGELHEALSTIHELETHRSGVAEGLESRMRTLQTQQGNFEAALRHEIVR